jgi:2-phosphosulfolactate phosphatase
MKVDCQWGRTGASQPAGVAIIVDVFSFSTSVVVAAGCGAKVFPFHGDAAALAERVGGRAASRERSLDAPSLSPASLGNLAPGEAIVLPSPNGARCALVAAAPHVFCGSLRNASAVAALAAGAGDSITVVPAGETWPDGSMRVAFEDMVGAGAIIARLGGDLTPEARAALAAFEEARTDLHARMFACPSGAELVARGFSEDVEIAWQLDASDVAPMLMLDRQRYRDAAPASEMADKRIRYFANISP